MRRSLPLLVLLLAGTASCGGGDAGFQGRDRSGGVSNAASSEAMAPAAPVAADSGTGAQRAAGGPNISPTAAPGVAFNYN